MEEGYFFSAKCLEESLFQRQNDPSGMVRPASSDFWKKPKESSHFGRSLTGGLTVVTINLS